MWSDHEVRRRIAFLERNIKRSGMASNLEIAACQARSSERKEPERWLFYWADLRTLIREKNHDHVDAEGLEAATRALEEIPEHIHLPTIGADLVVHPASWSRINVIETHAFNLHLCEAARAYLMTLREQGNASPVDKKPCSGCGRPLEPGEVFAHISRLGDEMSFQRASLYTQIVAPGPEPAEGELVTWAERITPAEHLVLLQAYHRCNSDVIARLPKLSSADGKRELQGSWSFLFARFEEREGRPAKHIMRDRSLAAVIAICVTAAIQQRRSQEKAREKAKKAPRGKGKRRSDPLDEALRRGAD